MDVRREVIGTVLVAALAMPSVALAQETIKIGNTIPYSGPVSAFGAIGKAMSAYFDKVNAEGGINGRKVELISYDDAYSPPKTVENTRKLVERDQVLFIGGTLGTAQNMAIRKYLNSKKVPHLFLGSGSSAWNDPKEYPWTMGWQPSYHSEGRGYGEFIAKNHAGKKIGILYQNDDFGKDYLAGLMEGLGDQKSNIVSRLAFEVSDPTVDSQILNMHGSGVEVFVNISTPKFTAQSIRKANELSWKPVHIISAVSTSVDAVLKPAGLEASEGLVSSVYLKEPSDPKWADDQGMKDFVAFMGKYYPDGDKNSIFPVIGYSQAMTIEKVLRAAGDNLSRDHIMTQAASLKDVELPMLVPGVVMNTSSTDFAPVEQLQLVQFKSGKWSFYKQGE